MKIQLPEHVKQIIHRLQQEGYDAYAVGGCVRDTLLGRSPQDWDITTSAKPQVVKSLFSHTIDTGIAHGTVTVMLDHTGYEVTTYRIDGEYEDARHPKTVTFTGNLVEDLKRRDFTINAMAYNDTAGLVDAFDGIGDLKRHVIRCVGIPHDRFGEDALRMLRALSGRAHTVCTGVSVRRGAQEERFAVSTRVFFRPMTDDEIRAYIKTGEPMDKAGAYGVQSRGALFVERIDGDFFNVMGLPVEQLGLVLARFGVKLL